MLTKGNCSGCRGGAVNVAGDLKCNSVVFKLNTVGAKKYGGAAHIAGSTSSGTIKNCSFHQNSAEQDGGALAVVDFATAIVISSNFENNTANYGGAMSSNSNEGQGSGGNAASAHRSLSNKGSVNSNGSNKQNQNVYT